MQIARSGTALAIVHTIVHGLHGLAHVEIPIPLSLLQSLFVEMVILPMPIIATVLLWTRFYRIGSWLLLAAITGSLLFGTYYHFIAMSPDRVSEVPFTGWGVLFQVSAISVFIVDGFGCWFGIWALKTIQQPERI
jgi:hypothetical protein